MNINSPINNLVVMGFAIWKTLLLVMPMSQKWFFTNGAHKVLKIDHTIQNKTSTVQRCEQARPD